MDGFKKLPKMQCFKTGGKVEAKAMCYGGKMKEGGKADIAQDKKIVKKAFAMHDKQEHPGEKTDLSKLKKGGRSKKAAGTVRKYKSGGEVNNVYEAKKSSGDISNIQKVKDIKPSKAAAPSKAAIKPAMKGSDVAKEKSKPTGSTKAVKVNEYKKGGKVKKCAAGGQPGATEAQQEYYDKNKAKAVKKEKAADYEAFGSRGDAAKKGMEEGRMDPMGTAYKKGGKIKKFAEGGFTAEEEKWLGGADRTDPIILARMRAALGEQKPQSSYMPNANPAMDNRDVGMPQGSYIPNANPAMDNRDVGMAPMRRPTPVALPAGPSADDRLRAKYGRPVQAPNVEQDSGVAYPQGKPAPNLFANREPSAMQRFFNATPAEQAANFQRGVQARKNFGKTTPSSTPSFSSLLDALNKPKV